MVWLLLTNKDMPRRTPHSRASILMHTPGRRGQLRWKQQTNPPHRPHSTSCCASVDTEVYGGPSADPSRTMHPRAEAQVQTSRRVGGATPGDALRRVAGDDTRKERRAEGYLAFAARAVGGWPGRAVVKAGVAALRGGDGGR